MKGALGTNADRPREAATATACWLALLEIDKKEAPVPALVLTCVDRRKAVHRLLSAHQAPPVPSSRVGPLYHLNCRIPSATLATFKFFFSLFSPPIHALELLHVLYPSGVQFICFVYGDGILETAKPEVTSM